MSRSRPKRAKATKPKKDDFFGERHKTGLQFTRVDDYFIFGHHDEEPMIDSRKVAAFDLDHTLVVPSSGRKFPTGRTDWKWWAEAVTTKLEELRAQRFTIVVFTNQSTFRKKPEKEPQILGKFWDICEHLDYPMYVCIAGDKDKYRKPNTLMWDHFTETAFGELDIHPDSFYCGDAAGRVREWDGDKKTKRDFSASDRMFASNIGIQFKTPEELFLGQEPTLNWGWRMKDPTELAQRYGQGAKGREHLVPAGHQEMVVLVGSPASGKSTISRGAFGSYTRINNDTLRSKSKCHRVCREALAAGNSVVIDNTNAHAEGRAEYLQMARDAGVPARALHVTTPRELALHLNCVRENVHGVKRIPQIAFNVFQSKFAAPSTDEGFESVEQVDFQLELSDEEFAKHFFRWTA